MWQVLAWAGIVLVVVFVGSTAIAGIWQGIKEQRGNDGKQDR